MWPFKTKLIAPPSNDVAHQLKSLTLPQAQPSWRLYAKNNPWNVHTAIAEGYNASAIVYACVEKRAKLLASTDWKAMRMVDGMWQHDPESPLQQLINMPNPDQSWYEIIYGASQNLDLSGNAFISEIRAGVRNQPQQLWLLPSQYIKIKPGRENLVEYFEYSYHTALGNKKIMPADMVQLKLPNPNDPYFGMPPLMAAGRATDIDRESGIWQKVSLENRGAADINIKLPDDATREQVASIREQYEKMQTGAKNARRALMTNADIQQLGMNAVELDFVESRKSVWTEITAAFGLSLSDLGMTENVNLSNAQEMNKALWQNTIIPLVELVERQLNHQLAVEFPGYKIKADLSNIEALQESQDTKLANAEKLFRMGVPFNELNKMYELGFDETASGETGYIPTGLIPVNFDISGEIGLPDDAESNEATVTGDNRVQDDALNGAQISSLSEIVQLVANGELPKDSAIALLAAAFPRLSQDDITSMINPAATFTPTGLIMQEPTEEEKALFKKMFTNG